MMSISKLSEKRKRELARWRAEDPLMPDFSEERLATLKKWRADDPNMLGVVYTIDPSLNPPTPQVAITMLDDFAVSWRRNHPHIPIMLFRTKEEFIFNAKILEAQSVHIDRKLSMRRGAETSPMATDMARWNTPNSEGRQ